VNVTLKNSVQFCSDIYLLLLSLMVSSEFIPTNMLQL